MVCLLLLVFGLARGFDELPFDNFESDDDVFSQEKDLLYSTQNEIRKLQSYLRGDNSNEASYGFLSLESLEGALPTNHSLSPQCSNQFCGFMETALVCINSKCNFIYLLSLT